MKTRMIQYYMDVAERTANLSYAVKLKVGAILVKNDNIVSFSWNGSPRGWDNTCEDKVWMHPDAAETFTFDEIISRWNFVDEESGKRYLLKTKSCVTHAEEALLMKIASSNESAEGASLFCTHSCCMNCAKLIYGAKIKDFYYINEYRSSEGIEFLKKCGIEVKKIER